MDELEESWPDPDRREDALERLAGDMANTEWKGGRTEITQMERRCLQAASVGLQASEIAATYGLSVETIKRQLTWARRRLRAKNTTHACCEALRQGLIQ